MKTLGPYNCAAYAPGSGGFVGDCSFCQERAEYTLKVSTKRGGPRFYSLCDHHAKKHIGYEHAKKYINREAA